jgi:ubiquinone/menaquinone biosynthesis C-methylase UbiE
VTTKKTDLTDATYVKDQYRDSTNLDARIALHARFSTATRRLPEWLFDHFDLPSGARVLEIGCGTGVLWSENRARIQADWQLTLTDLSLGMVETARAIGVPAAFAQCDAQAIPFASAYFDTVIASHMLHHVPDLSRALSEIRRVLKSGGRLYAATNTRDHMCELKALIAECGGVPLQMPEREFNLEYGAQHLSQYFADVQRVDYDDGLVVTEVEPLVAYVMSTAGGKQLRANNSEQRLRSTITERISRDGAIRISKAAGLFEATAA